MSLPPNLVSASLLPPVGVPVCTREVRAMKLTKKQKRKFRRRARLRQALRAARKKG